MKDNQFNDFGLEHVVFENVSSECARKTREVLEDLKIEISMYDLHSEEHVLTVLPKKTVVGHRQNCERVIGRDDSSAIVYFPVGARSYLQWLENVTKGEYVMDFVVGDSTKSGKGKNCLSIRRLEDQFTLYFFTNVSEAREFSEHVENR